MENNTDNYQATTIGEEAAFLCPVNAMIDVIAGKWRVRILWELSNGVKRFGELKELLPNITPAVLSAQLQALAQQGIINREVYAEVPPKSEYSLTDIGKSLFEIIYDMETWGNDFIKQSRPSISTNLFRPR